MLVFVEMHRVLCWDFLLLHTALFIRLREHPLMTAQLTQSMPVCFSSACLVCISAPPAHVPATEVSSYKFQWLLSSRSLQKPPTQENSSSRHPTKHAPPDHTVTRAHWVEESCVYNLRLYVLDLNKSPETSLAHLGFINQ